MFRDWENFYIIVGSSAGALIGLMFVVTTLTAGFEDQKIVMRGQRIYITPIVFHFAIVVVASAISAVPEIPPAVVSVLLAACAALGLVYAIVTTVRLFTLHWEEEGPDFSDRCFYGIFPVLAYLGLLAAAGAIWWDVKVAAYAVGALMVVLLLLGIRNAWDLATALVKRAGELGHHSGH